MMKRRYLHCKRYKRRRLVKAIREHLYETLISNATDISKMTVEELKEYNMRAFRNIVKDFIPSSKVESVTAMPDGSYSVAYSIPIEHLVMVGKIIEHEQ